MASKSLLCFSVFFTSDLLHYIWRRGAEACGGLMQLLCRVWLETPHVLCIARFLTRRTSFPRSHMHRLRCFLGGLNRLMGKNDNKHLVRLHHSVLIQLLLVLGCFWEVEGGRQRLCVVTRLRANKLNRERSECICYATFRVGQRAADNFLSLSLAHALPQSLHSNSPEVKRV